MGKWKSKWTKSDVRWKEVVLLLHRGMALYKYIPLTTKYPSNLTGTPCSPTFSFGDEFVWNHLEDTPWLQRVSWDPCINHMSAELQEPKQGQACVSRHWWALVDNLWCKGAAALSVSVGSWCIGWAGCLECHKNYHQVMLLSAFTITAWPSLYYCQHQCSSFHVQCSHLHWAWHGHQRWWCWLHQACAAAHHFNDAWGWQLVFLTG